MIKVYTLSSSDSHTQRQYQRIADYTTQHTQSQAIYLALFSTKYLTYPSQSGILAMLNRKRDKECQYQER